MNPGHSLLRDPGFAGAGGDGNKAVCVFDCPECFQLERIGFKRFFIRYSDGSENLFQATIGSGSDFRNPGAVADFSLS
jgi:hypothetical protein